MARYQRIVGGRYYFRKLCIQCWSAERSDYQSAYRTKHDEKLRTYHAEKYERNKPQINSAAKRHYRKLQTDVFFHYGNQCACCGEKEFSFLTLDHKNNDGADHRRKIGIGHVFYRWIIDNNYPDSIQLLCNNCNGGKHRNGGLCPHHNAYTSQMDFKYSNPFYCEMGI